ncbi:MAG TPA: cytochrome c [Gallionellaceae bacterium]|nr:cytochrome c [Gallionellaceae bacterium]
MHKLLATLTLLTFATAATAAPFANGDPATGKKLFDKYKCNSCHIEMVGGDGSGVFTRPNHKVTKPAELGAQMTRCSGMLGTNITPQEEEHLAAYLNQKYYKFK